jgi:hypothetical protein
MKIALRRLLIGAQIGVLVAIAPTASFADDAHIGAKIFDAVILRPLGTVKVFVGMAALIPASVLYTFRMPFDSDTGVYREAAEMLVIEPANFVFRRPLGEDLDGG